jgi:hypothetical protein
MANDYWLSNTKYWKTTIVFEMKAFKISVLAVASF